jgi:hypothetical protein
VCIDWNFGVFPFHELAIKPDKLAAFFLHYEATIPRWLIKILNYL